MFPEFRTLRPYLAMKLLIHFSLSLFIGLAVAKADPQLTSWFTAHSGKYARIYQSAANETAGTTVTTWSRGSGTQSNPAYATVSEVAYSTDWIYIRTSGLASHIMGPWYLDAAKTTNFPNFPSNTATIYRIPRTPAIPETKTGTGLGATGRMVNGVAMFDMRDAFSYSNSNATDAQPTNSITGDGIWNRDGYHNEGVTFDPALAHQAGNVYHYHAQPIGLRYQLGDHVDYIPNANRYTESVTAVLNHSPILAWAADGLPVYGPYGYSDPTNAASGVRRMISGFTLRNGTNGSTNITVRQVLPLWAQRIQGRATLSANQYGPAVNATYLLGHYIEDFDFRGDLGQTQTTGATVRDYDLNEQNVRFCVTPEFPDGTWAYFTTINLDGTPAYPYTTGRQYYGNPSGGAVTSITESITTYFSGGPNITETGKSCSVDTNSGTVTFTWSSLEGGTYKVEANSELTGAWTTLSTTQTAAVNAIETSYTETSAANTNTKRFYRVTRTALNTYDSAGIVVTGVPTVATGAATNTSTTGATLNGTVTANNISTAVSFEYGLTTAYGSTVTATPSSVTGSAMTSVSAAITALTANATYHFRTKGVNTAGTSYGSDSTFTATAGSGTAVAPGGSASRGSTVTITITLPTTPPLPPTNIVPNSIALAGTITGASISRPTQATAQATFAIPANAPTGLQNISVVFNPGPTYTVTFTIN